MECVNALGNMAERNEYISEFGSGDPQNYAYKLRNWVTGEQNTVFNLRGITINYNALKLVNFDVIKIMILKVRPNATLTLHSGKKIKRSGT
jgi:hypothetical protein